MSDTQSGSTLLTEGGGNPADQGGLPQGAAANPNAQPAAGDPSDPRTQDLRAQDWRTSLPDDLKANPSLSKYKDVGALASSYVNLEKLLGSEKIPLPKSRDDKDGWNRVYASLGRPEAADKYEIEVPTVPDGVNVPYDADEEKFWRNLAWENGLSGDQFKNMWDTGVKSRMDKAISWQTEQAAAKEKAADALRREWGNAYEGNLNIAKAAFRQYADPDLVQYLDETGLGNDPRFTKIYYKIGKAMNGTTRIQGQAKANDASGDLDREIIEYRAKYQAELYDKQHPNHDFHVAKLTRLFQARHGDQ